jgi:hypothetical protein
MKSRLILVVAASALLASCGSTASSSPAATSSAPATSVPADYELETFLANCLQNNGRVVTTSGTTSFTTDYYGNVAVYNEAGEAAKTGYIVNGTQGIFEFTVENDAVVLGQPVSSATSILSAMYTLADLSAASLSDFVSAGANAYTVEAGETVSNTATALYGVSGLSFDYLSSTYITAPLAVTLTADSLTCSFEVSGTAVSFVIKDLHSISLSFIKTYIQNPTVVAAPTAFNTAIVSAEASLFGEGITIPFPSGVTALFRQDVGYSDDDTPVINGISLTQFGKDISASYIAQLTAAGYVETVVSTLFGEETTYQKTISEQSETEGAHVIVITCAYDSDYEETDIAVSLSVLPITYEGSDLTKANSYLTAYNTTTLSIPSLPASEKITKVLTEDSAPMDGQKLELNVTLSIAAEADANAYVKAYDPLILAAGFTANSTYNLANYASNGFIEYSDGDVNVCVIKTTSDSGVYGGTIAYAFSDSTAA